MKRVYNYPNHQIPKNITETGHKILLSYMCKKTTAERRCRRILEENGGDIADEARTILLEDPALKDLAQPLKFISENWRDLTPALIRLSCKAVGGRTYQTHEVSLAICLINLSMYIWDDMIDNVKSKAFRPTIFGKFGANTSLIIGGLASAKAFSILNEMKMEKAKRLKINQLVWDFLTKMAKAETVSARLRFEKKILHTAKMWKIKMEAIGIETCLHIGAIIGDGTKREIHHLRKYGHNLGIILALWNDSRVSLNLTLELADKIRSGKMPFTLLWACAKSERLRSKIYELVDATTIAQADLKEIVKETLETKVLEYTERKVRYYTQQAEKELMGLKKNNATQTLKSLVDAQPKLFAEIL